MQIDDYCELVTAVRSEPFLVTRSSSKFFWSYALSSDKTYWGGTVTITGSFTQPRPAPYPDHNLHMHLVSVGHVIDDDTTAETRSGGM